MPINLYVKSGMGVKLAYDISYVCMSIATKSSMKVY